MADTTAPTEAAPQQEAPASEPEVPKPEVAATPEVSKTETEVAAPEAAKTEPEVPKPEVVAEPVVAATEVPAAEAATPAEGEEKKETYAALPKPKYNPMHAHTVHHSRSYASTVIADQEMLLANLRNMRRELEKEDRQLTIMSKTLFDREYPRKWTLPNSYKNEEELRGGYALIHICKRSKLN